MSGSIPQLVTGFVGGVLVVAFFMPPLEPLREEFSLFFDILAAFAFVLGGASLLGRHRRRIRERVEGWGWSVVLISAFGLTLLAGLTKVGSPDGLSGQPRAEGSLFAWIYDHIFSPADAALFSLLAFYVASAAFRAFRLRSAEATVMLVTAFLLLLGRTFLGNLVTAWLPPELEPLELPNVVQWIMAVPLTAGNRAITIGVALGTVAVCLKVILGLDRPQAEGGR